jgi:hypothetical protein
MTYPWILHFTTHTPDWGGEGSLGLWNIWYFRYGLSHGSPFETQLLAPPYKLNLIFHTYTLSRDIFGLLLLSLFNLVITSNLLTWLSFSLSGLGVYLIVHDLTDDSLSSFVAGLVYAFTPYRFAHLSGHYNLISIEWIPFYALYALRYFHVGKRSNLILAALFSLLTSLTDYYYALYLIVWSGLLSLYWLIFRPEKSKALARTGYLVGITFLVHLPLIGLMVWGISQGGWVGRPTGSQMLETFSADILGFIIPSAQHPIFGVWAEQISQGWNTHFAEHTVYLGITPLFLILFATFTFRKWTTVVRWWIVAFWIFVLLALGPVPHWDGQALFPLPYQWLIEVPLFREARIPSRWIIMAIMSLAVVVGQILTWITQRWNKFSFAINTCIATIILFEYLPAPLYLGDRSVPLVYYIIAQDTQQGSVLDMPLGLNDSFTSVGGWNPRAMYFQTITAKPIIGAHISRIPISVIDAYTQMSIIGRLAKIEQGENYTTADIKADQRLRNEVAQILNLRFIVIPDWYEEEPGSDYIIQVFSNCLEKLSGDNNALGFRVLRPCPPTD